MTTFYRQSFLFWFVFLILALVNATIREMTYKPFLSPYIGIWAHQLSSIIAILLFYGAIRFFLTSTKAKYARKDLIIVGFMWVVMTVIFESSLNIFVRKLDFQEILATYYFWNGELWIFVLLSLVVSPLLIYRSNKHVPT